MQADSKTVRYIDRERQRNSKADIKRDREIVSHQIN